MTTASQAGGLSLRYLGQYNGEAYIKVTTPVSLRAGEVIIYSASGGATIEVARWDFCPMAGSATVHGPLPGPGTYLIEAVQYDKPCWPGGDMFYVEFYSPVVAGVQTASVYLCKNSTWGVDCDFDSADMASLLPIGVKTPIGDDVIRLSVNLFAPGFISMRLYRGDSVVYDMGSVVHYPIIVDVVQTSLFPKPVILLSSTTLAGSLTTGARFAAYIFGVAGVASSRNAMDVLFSVFAALMVDRLFGAVFSPSLGQ
ncbi:MAG: hypothetical protein ACP5I3_09070 [Thermoproteus sp.]